MRSSLMKQVWLLLAVFLLSNSTGAQSAFEGDRSTLQLVNDTKSVDVYNSLYMVKDRKREMTIEDIAAKENENLFIPSGEVSQKKGFFNTGKWLRFDLTNDSEVEEWLLELAFPLINEIRIYSKDEAGLEELYVGGANYPFHEREIKHRHFIYKIHIPSESVKTFFIGVHSSGDLHPPIRIWKKDAFLEKTQEEFVMLGLFYGMILIMIIYNLFLYFSLRMKSYLYYVCVITCTLIAQVSINGMIYPYIWPNTPIWNAMSTPMWVSFACIFILLFTRSFLGTDTHVPKFKRISYLLMAINGLVIVALPFSLILALNIMLIGTISTFFTVLLVAFISLKRGARQARFFLAGWIVFLVGVSITILERAALIPFSLVTDYAGQTTVVMEVALLSLALADKINIMRSEKQEAEQKALESEVLEKANKGLEVLNANLLAMAESRRNLLSNIAHELGTPVTMIHSYMQALREGLVDPADTHFSSLVSGKINVLNRLIDDLTDLSILEAGQTSLNFTHLNVGNWLEEMVEKFQFDVLQYERVFESDYEADAIFNYDCHIDRDRMLQVFSNLILNAVKFTSPTDGIIVLKASMNEGDRTLTIQIKDNGIGIKKENIPSIFERFYTESNASADGSGRGLGLAIVKEIMLAHNGDIYVESELSKGTAFSIILPVEARTT